MVFYAPIYYLNLFLLPHQVISRMYITSISQEPGAVVKAAPHFPAKMYLADSDDDDSDGEEEGKGELLLFLNVSTVV